MTAADEFPKKAWLDGKRHTVKADDPAALADALYLWAHENGTAVHVEVQSDSVTLRFDS